MSKQQQPEALRLAYWLEQSVQTYPQISEDEAGGYCSEQDQMMDFAATELRRLHAENAALKRELIKESARTAAEKRRADQMSLQHSMQDALNKDAREKLARYAAEEIAIKEASKD